MRPSSAKAKGRKLQQVVRDAVLNCFPFLTDKDVKSTTMGESGIDVQLSEAARKLFPWAVECKNYSKIAVYAWWEQATKAAESEKLAPLLVIKANLKEPLACLRLEDFMKLTRGGSINDSTN